MGLRGDEFAQKEEEKGPCGLVRDDSSVDCSTGNDDEKVINHRARIAIGWGGRRHCTGRFLQQAYVRRMARITSTEI